MGSAAGVSVDRFFDVAHELAGRYKLNRAIARVSAGGYVYAGSHVFTRRPCAVKLFDRTISEKARKRARREIDVLARVQGPGVVFFQDAGESDGRLYLVFDLLEGRTLAAKCAAKGRLEVDAASRIASELSDALHRCHERGIVHRDLKPANVFVTTADEVVLLDFGIAKIVDTAPMDRLTQENALLGTPEYMAPEALVASPDVDHRADQWALGITLYECLAGFVPFEGDVPAVLRKIRAAPPRPLPSVRDDVPPALDAVVRKMLSIDPAERFRDLVEVRAALRDAIRAREAPTVADAPQARARSGGARRRHPRAPYVTLARIRRQDGTFVDGRVEEISEAGFQFVGDRAISDAEQVTVRFALPVSGRVTEAAAVSRWHHTARGLSASGFELSTMTDDALAELRRYIAIMRVE